MKFLLEEKNWKILDDLFDGADFPLPTLEEETIKRDSRRKIEIYWEKKRLREQLDEDFDDSDFDF